MPSSHKPPRKPGFRVSLSPEHDRRCSCGTLVDYSHPYDAKFCRRCDRWLETRCSDRGCEFCAKRPTRPSLAADLDPAERTASPQSPFNPPRLTPGKRG